VGRRVELTQLCIADTNPEIQFDADGFGNRAKSILLRLVPPWGDDHQRAASRR
jgi:hypothetical protein